MTPGRLRILGLLALAVPVAATAAASSESTGFPALALASAAAGLAMLLAGRVFRTILAVLLALLGLCVVLVALTTPEVGGLVWLAFGAGILQLIVAVGLVLTVRAWPASTSRYSRSRVAGDRASDWDALTEGDDPTDRPTAG